MACSENGKKKNVQSCFIPMNLHWFAPTYSLVIMCKTTLGNMTGGCIRIRILELLEKVGYNILGTVSYASPPPSNQSRD